MNFDLNSFDADSAVEEAPSMDFKPIPKGTYMMFVDSAEQKTSQSGNDYFNLKLTIADGEYEGKSFFVGLHVNAKSEKAQKINRGKLGNLIKLTQGEGQGIQDISELANGTMFEGNVTVSINEYNGEKRQQNDVWFSKKKDDDKPTKEVKKETTKKVESNDRPDFDDDDM